MKASASSLPDLAQRRKNWDSSHWMHYSRNNPLLTANCRDYFDRPRTLKAYDAFSLSEPVRVTWKLEPEPRSGNQGTMEPWNANWNFSSFSAPAGVPGGTNPTNVSTQRQRARFDGHNMGITWSSWSEKIWMHLLGLKERKIVMVGLDAAGKTTVLYRLKLNELVMTIPTIGFNVETVEYRNLRLTVWDIGGQDLIRPLWKHYFLGSHAMIFVVDSSDHHRIQEAKQELWRMLKEPDFFAQAPVLVLANKQDLPDAMSVREMTEKLGLLDVTDRPILVQPSSAPKGEGLFEGLAWLSKAMQREGVEKNRRWKWF
eukprot:symbB.v1.2.022780.t1/scaffold2060.1/size90856/2